MDGVLIMARTAYRTIDGIKYRYSYRDVWGVRYYSFDGERTWKNCKADAIRQAMDTGLMCADNQFYRKYTDGRIEVVNA